MAINKTPLTPTEQTMVERMKEKDDYIVVGVGNIFWANQNHRGCLIEALTWEEKDAIDSLTRKNLLKHNSHTYNL